MKYEIKTWPLAWLNISLVRVCLCVRPARTDRWTLYWLGEVGGISLWRNGEVLKGDECAQLLYKMRTKLHICFFFSHLGNLRFLNVCVCLYVLVVLLIVCICSSCSTIHGSWKIFGWSQNILCPVTPNVYESEKIVSVAIIPEDSLKSGVWLFAKILFEFSG